MSLHPGPRPTAPADPYLHPDQDLTVARDPAGRVVELAGDGVRHGRRDAPGGWTVVDDPAGATALRQDEERTELLRDGLLLAQHRMRGAEEWTLPGTPEPVRIERDSEGEVRTVLVGGRIAAARADGATTRVLRWATGDVGTGPDGLHAAGRSGGGQEWAAGRDDDGLRLGRDHYRFDAQGRVVEHRHPETGRTGYVFAGHELAAVESPTGRLELLHGPDGRVRVRRDPDGRTTYGYDERGRRIRETRPDGTRRLAWDALDRLVAVADERGWTLRYGYDGFGRRVSRTETAAPGATPIGEARSEVRLEHRDLQGRLWVVTDAAGRALRTFVWDRHRCLAAFTGPAGPAAPDAVYVTAPSGVPVGYLDRDGGVHDLPATPYAEDRPAAHPALWFHLADERTGYVHLTQRDADPATWQFLSPDPYRSDEAEAAGAADRRRLLPGVDGPLAYERDDRTTPYALCGFDPVRRVDPNGAISAGTGLWQLLGGLTWHLPAHTINWLWIHPVVNFSFASILAWLPASGFDPRGSFDSWWEFWLPSNYSFEKSERQDIGSELMAGWMSSNRTFTFQNAIWGRRREWDALAHVASLQPDAGTPYTQQRPGSLLRITRGGDRAADVVDVWTMVADGIDTQAAATRRYDLAGGTAHGPILGAGRDRLISEPNLHLFRQVRSIGVNLPGTDPNAPTAGPVELHARATAVQECAPGAACAQVTLRTAAQVFTYSGVDPATVDGDVVRLDGVLALVTAVQPNAAGTATELSVQAGNAGLTLPAPGAHTAQWATLDAAGVQNLAAFAGDTTRLVLPDATVGWTPGSIARLNGFALAPVDLVESHLQVTAQTPLTAGGDVVPLGAPVPVVGATLEPDERLRVPDGAVGAGAVLRLTRGGGVRLARVTAVADDAAAGQDLLTLDSTPAALGLPGGGNPGVDVLTPQPVRGRLAADVPAGVADAVTNLEVNAGLGANVVGIDVSGGLAVVAGPETRVIHLSIPNPVGGAGPWNVERFTFPAAARTHAGTLSDLLEIATFGIGDAAATIPTDALLRLRSVNVPAAAPPVAGLVRDSDTTFTRPAVDPTLGVGDLLVVSGATTAVVCVADLAVTVTLDRIAGNPNDTVARVCSLVPGERTYDVVRVDNTVRLTGTATPGAAAALLPDWVAGDIVATTIGGTVQEWVLAAAPDGGRLDLRGGPGAIAGVAGATGTVQRQVPSWPPLTHAVPDPARTSQVLAPAPPAAAQHRWITRTGAIPAGAVGIDIDGTVFVARATVTAVQVRTSPLPAALPPAALAGYSRLARSSATDRISARWHLVGDEIEIRDRLAPTPAGGATVVLDALAPVATTAVTPKEQALMLPAEPENPRWIFTALESLREHELRHTVQASAWGPMFLGLPFGVFGDALWDLRGGSGRFEASPFEPVAPVPEETGDRPRPAAFRLTTPTGQFRLAVGEVVEFELDGRAWRTVITAVDVAAATFWVQNLPPDGLGEATAKARTLHHTDPQGDIWLKILRVADLFTNAHLMEFTSGLIFEGLIGLFWRLGRLLDFAVTKTADVTVTDTGRVTLHAADEKALAALRLDVGSEVIVDSNASRDDSVRTVVTGLLGTDVTVRDAVPRYPDGARIRLRRGQDKDPDDFWDLRTYRPATLEAGATDVISVPGTPPPGFRAMDLLAIEWTGSTGTPHSLTARVSTALDGTPPRYKLDARIELDGADPDTLRIALLRNDDDPATQWFDTGFYETPIRIRRVTKYLFDPWRAITLDTGFTRPADGSTFKTVLAWIARGVRYAVSNRSWIPGLGYVIWNYIGGPETHGLEQSASWHGGDLYSTITRSGDPRFQASEGDHGEGAGDYGIVEGEFLRMWTWDAWRWNDVFASREQGTASVAAAIRAPTQNPALISAAVPVTPCDDRWRFTAPTAGIVAGLEYPAELAQRQAPAAPATFRPSPLLQIPTRADVSRNSGVYFVACQAGAWQVGVARPTSSDVSAQAAGAQFHTRTVQVGALTVTANGTPLPWQQPGVPAALTLFLTESVAISVAGGNGGTYRVRPLDPAEGPNVFRAAGLTLQARITRGVTETVEVVRVHDPADPYFATFGTYLAQPLAVPVRRFEVTVTDAITLRNGPDPTSPVADVATPVPPGAVVSALLPVTTSVLPTAAYTGVPAGAPPLPTVTGPLPAGNLNRYDIAVSAQPPQQPVTVDITFRFTDPHPAGAGAFVDVPATFAVQPAAILAGPDQVARGASALLTVTPSDGSALVPTDVTTGPGADTPTPGVTVAVTAAGDVQVTADAAAPVAAFVVEVLWQGRPARHSMRVT